VDLVSYIEGKEAKGVTLTKLGPETYQMIAKTFNPATGRETYPEVLTIKRQNILDAKAQAEKALEEANKRVIGTIQLLSDIDALDANESKPA
jgi:hypothetical protein